MARTTVLKASIAKVEVIHPRTLRPLVAEQRSLIRSPTAQVYSAATGLNFLQALKPKDAAASALLNGSQSLGMLNPGLKIEDRPNHDTSITIPKMLLHKQSHVGSIPLTATPLFGVKLSGFQGFKPIS